MQISKNEILRILRILQLEEARPPNPVLRFFLYLTSCSNPTTRTVSCTAWLVCVQEGYEMLIPQPGNDDCVDQQDLEATLSITAILTNHFRVLGALCSSSSVLTSGLSLSLCVCD